MNLLSSFRNPVDQGLSEGTSYWMTRNQGMSLGSQQLF